MLIISFIATKFLNPCSTAFLQKLQSDCLSGQSVIHTFNTGIKEHNFQKIDQIFYEYSHLNIMSILLQNIKKNQNSQSDKLLSEKQLNFCIMRSCNIFFNTISFIPHSWYLNGFNKEHTSMLLVSTLFRRKTMCIFT